MANFTNINSAMGYQNPVQGLAPLPIVARRNPTINDKATIGQLFINEATNTGFICLGELNNLTQWGVLAQAAVTVANNSNPPVATINALTGVAQFTIVAGTVIAPAGTEIFTINDSYLTATSAVSVTVSSNSGTGVTQLGGVVTAAGTMGVEVVNAGAGNIAVGNIVTIAFQIIAP